MMIYLFPVQLGRVCGWFFMELTGKMGTKSGWGDRLIGLSVGALALILVGFVFSVAFLFFPLIVVSLF